MTPSRFSLVIANEPNSMVLGTPPACLTVGSISCVACMCEDYRGVCASRFRSRDGLFLYGRIRRSDWTPVATPKDHWARRRGCDSISTQSDNDSGRSDSDGCDSGRSDYESDASSDVGFCGEETDTDVSCSGNYWDEGPGCAADAYDVSNSEGSDYDDETW